MPNMLKSMNITGKGASRSDVHEVLSAARLPATDPQSYSQWVFVPIGWRWQKRSASAGQVRRDRISKTQRNFTAVVRNPQINPAFAIGRNRGVDIEILNRDVALLTADAN